MKTCADDVGMHDSIVLGSQLPSGSRQRQWSNRCRPRERLLSGDATGLTDADLLAVCLGSGTSGRSGVALAQQLLERYGSVGAVLYAPVERLLSERGLGMAKVATLKAVLGLAERVAREELGDSPVLSSSLEVQRLLQLKLSGLQREVFACLMLDSRHRLLKFEVLFSGTIDSANVYPREIIKRCLELNAAAVILAHNHPSGMAEPSLADIALTGRLRPLLTEVGVRLLDHIVVGRGQSVSMAERGLLS